MAELGDEIGGLDLNDLYGKHKVPSHVQVGSLT